jgi:hypothetical protein
MNHTLLPQHLQQQLMDAAVTERLDRIDAAINSVRHQAPFKFHTDESLKTRVFFDQPRGQFVGGFINPAPARV